LPELSDGRVYRVIESGFLKVRVHANAILVSLMLT